MGKKLTYKNLAKTSKNWHWTCCMDLIDKVHDVENSKEEGKKDESLIKDLAADHSNNLRYAWFLTRDLRDRFGTEMKTFNNMDVDFKIELGLQPDDISVQFDGLKILENKGLLKDWKSKLDWLQEEISTFKGENANKNILLDRINNMFKMSEKDTMNELNENGKNIKLSLCNAAYTKIKNCCTENINVRWGQQTQSAILKYNNTSVKIKKAKAYICCGCVGDDRQLAVVDASGKIIQVLSLKIKIKTFKNKIFDIQKSVDDPKKFTLSDDKELTCTDPNL